jgi:molybdenum cofactor guanylyltransferase
MLTIVIQAGGESRRMGQDKALLPFLGKPLIQRILDRVEHLAGEVLVTTNRPDAYTFLGLPLFSDIIPGRGALGGLYTALKIAQNPFVAVIACDMPFVSPELIKVEQGLLVSEDQDAVIPRIEGETEPFHAVYRRDACLPAVQASIEADQWRVNSWFPKVRLRYLSEAEVRKVDPKGLAFWNVNTPEDLRRAEELANLEGHA